MIALSLALALTAPRAVVMPIVPGEAISPRSAQFLTDALAAEGRRQGIAAFAYRDMAVSLTPEEQEKVLRCRTDLCLGEAAGSAGADWLIVAEVDWDGQALLLRLRALAVRPLRVLAVVHRRFLRGTQSVIMAALPSAMKELVSTVPPAEPVAQPDVRPRPEEHGTAPPASPAPSKRTRRSARELKPSPPPTESTFILHYRRPDKRYGSVGLYTWVTFNEGEELRRTLPSAVDVNTHPPTVAPDGIDDFGAYWIIPTHQFRNGRVNFQVHLSWGWDECGPGRTWGGGKGMFWILADGREAWLDVRECELHPSLATALQPGR